MYACTTNCPFGHASVAVLDILAHSIADNDAPHRNPESPEIHPRLVIFHQLRAQSEIGRQIEREKKGEYEQKMSTIHTRNECREEVNLILSV